MHIHIKRIVELDTTVVKTLIQVGEIWQTSLRAYPPSGDGDAQRRQRDLAVLGAPGISAVDDAALARQLLGSGRRHDGRSANFGKMLLVFGCIGTDFCK